MFTVTKDRKLLTMVIGSLPLPAWFTAALDGKPLSHALADSGFREQYFDLLAAYIADQQRAGLDLLVDGDARLDGGVGGRHWIAYVEERLGGLGPPRLGCLAPQSPRSPPARSKTTSHGKPPSS